MENLVITCFVVLLLLQGTWSQGAGQSCSPYAARRRLLGMCSSGLTCDSQDNTCRIDEGGSCEPREGWCKKDTFCDEDCLICKVKAGKTCRPGVQAHCLSHASCEEGSGECRCDVGYTASHDNTRCSSQGGGPASTVVSLTPLAACFLACRLF